MTSNTSVEIEAVPVTVDGEVVTDPSKIPVMVATEQSVIWTAWAILTKVSEGQAVLKKEAALTAEQLNYALQHNQMRLVPLSEVEAEKLANRDIEGAVELALSNPTG